MNRAVFLDRDGVINVDGGYVHKIDDFEYIKGVFTACRSLKEMGYKLVVVTNQSGIGRGLYSEEQFEHLTQWMDWNFIDKGVKLDGIYYCPHHHEKGLGEYKCTCDCRKPNPGMLNSAAQFLEIDQQQSVMVGDHYNDMSAAKAAGIPVRILVRTGKELTDKAIAAATVTVDSIVDVPAYLATIDH